MIEKINIRDGYKYYRRNNENPVDLKTFMHIATGFLSFMMRKILDGFQVQVSNAHSMGVFAIVGRKPRITFDENGRLSGLAVDWKETNKLWAEKPELREQREYIFYTNDHSNGFRYNFVWWKTDMKIGYKNLYSFTFSKVAKRKLSANIKAGKEYLTYNR